jgi:hypothetical protein
VPDPQFALMVEDDEGPIFRDFWVDLEEARRKAQEAADRQGLPVLIFSFAETKIVARLEPRPKLTQP